MAQEQEQAKADFEDLFSRQGRKRKRPVRKRKEKRPVKVRYSFKRELGLGFTICGQS